MTPLILPQPQENRKQKRLPQKGHSLCRSLLQDFNQLFRILSLRLVAILIAGMLIVFCVLGSPTSGADYLLYKERLTLSILLLPQRISLFIRQTA